MDPLLSELHQSLLLTYRTATGAIDQLLKSSKKLDLSISELHMIEVIAKEKQKPKTISDIAQEMDLSLPSVTVTIQKLEKKGYVEKFRNETDRRVVCVRITRMGRKMDAVSRYFHRQILLDMTQDMTLEEKQVLLKSIRHINDYFTSIRHRGRE